VARLFWKNAEMYARYGVALSFFFLPFFLCVLCPRVAVKKGLTAG